jgi:TolB-like protein/DNA-binding winged helix-turn-helix (wHTH) protein/tetratricopeptide (TPR) repeat protein
MTQAAPPALAFDGFVIDFADERVIGPAGPLHLGHKAFRVLSLLAARRGQLVTKDELFESVWDGAAVSESALTSVIKELRRALGDDTRPPRFIESAYGRGYRFVAEVHETASPAAPPRPVPSPAAPVSSRRNVLIGAGALALAGGAGALWYARSDRSAPTAAPAVQRVAVLPLANVSDDAGQQYFADGMTEELRDRLARLPAFDVAARTSSEAVHKQGLDARAIGRALGVAWLIEGSVRRAGPLVRVSATLIDARTGFQRWTRSYDRKLDDVFAIQGEIAQAVTSEVFGRLGGGDVATLARSATLVPEAFDAYAKGRALFDLSADRATYRAALGAFDRADELDPKYAAAWGQRARVLAVIANQFALAQELRGLYARGLDSARKAVALDPRSADAQAALAYLLVSGRLDFAGAARAYQQAYALGGHNADILIPYGAFAARVGRNDDALTATERAVRLDPLNPRSHFGRGYVLFALRRWREAAAALRRALELSPEMSTVHGTIGTIALMLGRPDQAKTEFTKEPADFVKRTGLAIAEDKLGNRAGAEAAMARLVADSGDAAAYQQAQVLAQWGERDKAFAALDLALRIGDSGLGALRIDPLLDPLRGDPRFAALLAKLGLPGSIAPGRDGGGEHETRS